MIRQAVLWHKDGERVKCVACARRCSIPEGSGGFCFVRRNIGGKLKLVNYGIVSSVQMDPIEKKPFNHFMPGAYVLGLGTTSCNFGCMFCQNHNISKEREISGIELLPKHAVKLALDNGAQGIAFTYNEPTIFIEYAIDVAKEAHRNGLATMFVSNGYMTREAVALMKGHIDAVVVDFKGNAERTFANKYEAIISNDPVKEALLALKEAGIHIEITDLIIPRVGDSIEACRELALWIVENLGPNTPVHFTRFYPEYKMTEYPPTPLATLKAHYKAAKDAGLKYVYIGNVPGTEYESTYCPECGFKVIGRSGFSINSWDISENGTCRNCGARIPLRGSLHVHEYERAIRPIY